MSYQDRLTTEINAELDALAERDLPWQAEFIAHAIVARHNDGLAEGDHRDFWTFCGYAKVREETRRTINKRAGRQPESATAEQLILPGYQHVHRYYVVNRDGDDVGVSVHALTDAEIDTKAAFYRSMGDACFSHADELARFKVERGTAGAAALPA